MIEVKINRNIRYEFGEYDNADGNGFGAFIKAYDNRQYKKGEWRPFGEGRLMSVANYATKEHARTVFDRIQENK